MAVFPLRMRKRKEKSMVSDENSSSFTSSDAGVDKNAAEFFDSATQSAYEGSVLDFSRSNRNDAYTDVQGGIVDPEQPLSKEELRNHPSLKMKFAYWRRHLGEFQAWVKLIELGSAEGLTISQQFLYNEDLRPVEEVRRKWKWYHFVNLWISDAINVNTWQIASTGMVAGLSWWETWIAVWIGYGLAGGFVAWSSKVGSYNHISFPVTCRSSFGIYGSLWPVVNRVVLACVWFSTQAWIMGQCVQLMLLSIFGLDVAKRIGENNLSGTGSFEFLCYFIAWVIHLPAIWFPPQTIRHLFTVKAFVAPISAFAFLIWALIKAHGAGSALSVKDTMNSSDRGWSFVYMTMSALSNYATLIVNAPDFSRFAKHPTSSQWSQAITIPFAFSITALIGLLVASTSGTLYGSILWNPLDVLRRFLDHQTAGNRGGVFMIAFGLAIAQLGTNICANSLSAGTDMTALLPKFTNIRRGGYICAMIALCICPWNFFASGATFTTYLSAYAIFLSSITGVILSDYMLRRGQYILMELYCGDARRSRYMFGTRCGCNWRGFAAYLLALVPNMPGFAGAVGRTVPIGAQRLYDLNYLVGFFVAFILYFVFNMIVPPKGLDESVSTAKGMLLSRVWLEHDQDVESFDEDFRNGRNYSNLDTPDSPELPDMSPTNSSGCSGFDNSTEKGIDKGLYVTKVSSFS